MKLLQEYARINRIKLIKTFLKHSDRILDLGCGDGWLKKGLPEHNIISTDLWNGNLLSNATLLPFRNESFDKVIVIEVLEHINCQDEIKRVLKPNGLMIVTIPNPDKEAILDVLILLDLVGKKITPHINKLRCKDINMELIYHMELFMNMSEFGVFKKR